MGEYKIIDMHAHIFPDKIADKAVKAIGDFYGIAMKGKGTASDLLKCGSRAGVNRFVVHSSATKAEQVKSINDYIAFKSKSDEHLIGFGTIHPDFDDIEGEIERIKSLGLKGIKLHPEFQNFKIDDECMFPIYRATQGKLPILMHMGDKARDWSHPKRLAKVIDVFPDLTVIAAHFGGYLLWDQAEQYLVGKKIYMDTSSSLFLLDDGKALDMIRKHGTDRIVFGTDYPVWTHEDELKRLFRLDLNEQERKLILRENICRLLEL